MATCGVTIEEVASGSHAVVNPGIVQVDAGDTITFTNATTSQLKVLFAEGGLVKDAASGQKVDSMQGKTINGNRSKSFEVLDKAPGIYEYVVTLRLSSGNRVFAIGASTPKIIIRPPSAD